MHQPAWPRCNLTNMLGQHLHFVVVFFFGGGRVVVGGIERRRCSDAAQCLHKCTQEWPQIVQEDSCVLCVARVFHDLFLT